MVNLVVAADTRRYDRETLEKCQRESADGVLRSPFTREAMPAPVHVPQLVAVAYAYDEKEIAQDARLKLYCATRSPTLPRAVALCATSFVGENAERSITHQRSRRGGVIDLQHIDVVLVQISGVTSNGPIAQAMLVELVAQRCLVDAARHLAPDVTEARREAVSMRYRRAWRVGPRPTEVQGARLVATLCLVRAEVARVAALRRVLAKADARLACAQQGGMTSRQRDLQACCAALLARINAMAKLEGATG